MRRAVALIASLSVLQLGLTACGEDAGEIGGSVQVSGEFGQEPSVTFPDTPMNLEETEVTVLEQGDGREVPEGGSAFLHYYIGNGYLGEKAVSTWDVPENAGKKAKAEPRHPDYVVDGGNTWPAVREAMVGQKAGTRLQVLATPEDAFSGQGAPGVGIGNQDPVVWVIDIMSVPLPAPEGAEKPLPEGLPSIVESDGKVSGLDFSDAAKQPAGYQVVPLVEGTGPEVEKGAPVALRYLGQVWGAKEPFDSNFTAPFAGFTNPQDGSVTPAVFGRGQYIPAWDEEVPGLKVGSRVLLVVPPAKGYGKQGNKQAGIKGTDTLVFVLDILGQG